MSEHAKYSPSASERWIACPGSIRMSEGIDASDSDYAVEGRLAHKLAEDMLKDIVISCDNTEMREAVQQYVDYCRSLDCDYSLVEQRVDLTPDCFGTADFIGVSGNILHIVDLKYGKGIRVNAGSQLKLYAIGALNMLDMIYDINIIKLHIVQPRLDHIDVIEFNNVSEFKEQLQNAFNSYEVVPGDHCRWCCAGATCSARAQLNLSLAQNEFAAESMTLAQIAELLPKLDGITAWIKSVKEYALQQALSGKDIPGHKIVTGRSVSKWNDDAGNILQTLPGAENFFRMEIIGITEARKYIDKETMTKLTYKPLGKPTLVPESDKREKINNINDDFNEA